MIHEWSKLFVIRIVLFYFSKILLLVFLISRVIHISRIRSIRILISGYCHNFSLLLEQIHIFCLFKMCILYPFSSFSTYFIRKLKLRPLIRITITSTMFFFSFYRIFSRFILQIYCNSIIISLNVNDLCFLINI